MNTYQHIEVNITDGLGTITLTRPPVNILNIAMMGEINDVLKGWQNQENLKVVLFNAKGKCFSAGVDVGEHTGDMAPRMISEFHSMFRLLDTLGTVTMASIFGSCLGGGCELAVFCDLVLAAENSQLGQPEIKVGVFPPIAAQILPRIIGRKAASELIFSGKIISAQEAFSLGLVNKVVKDEILDEETEKFVRPYLGLSAKVLKLTKKAIAKGLMDELEPSLKAIEDIYLDELMSTHDAHEGLNAFLEKRKPEWENR